MSPIGRDYRVSFVRFPKPDFGFDAEKSRNGDLRCIGHEWQLQEFAPFAASLMNMQNADEAAFSSRRLR